MKCRVKVKIVFNREFSPNRASNSNSCIFFLFFFLQQLVTISTPAYHKKDIASATTVKVQVRCNGMYSNTMSYAYMPQKDGKF